ncbi:MAG: hypothetical protein AAGF84_11430 [Planctomycetota bacterium]
MALTAQSLPFGLSLGELVIYTLVILFWGGSWLATQAAAARKKAAQRERQAPKPKREARDAFAEELNRTAPRETPDQAAPSMLERRAASRPDVSDTPRPSPLQARMGSSPTPSVPPTPSGPVQPPELGMLLRDPKKFAAQMQAYAEQQAQPQGTPSAKPAGNAPGRAANPNAPTNRPIPQRSQPQSQAPRPRPTPRPARPPAPPRAPLVKPKSPAEATGSSGGMRPLSIGSARRDANVSGRSSGSLAVQLGQLNREDLRKAILLSEIIQPPVSMRQSHPSGRSS